MHESERTALESARNDEAEKSAAHQKATEEAAAALKAEQARLAVEYGKMQTELEKRAHGAAKRFLNLMMNKALANAFAKLKSHVAQRIFLKRKWAEMVEYHQDKLKMKLRKEIAKKRKEKAQAQAKQTASELEKARAMAAELKQKQLLQLDDSQSHEERYNALSDKYQKVETEFRAMVAKYGRQDVTKNAAEAVADKFREQIMDEIARRQRDGDEVDLNAIFESFDSDGNGTLSQKELVVGLREFGIKLSKEERKELLAMLDGDSDGEIDWREFAAVIQRVQEEALHDLERQQFEEERAKMTDSHSLAMEQLSLLEGERGGLIKESKKVHSSKAAQAVAAKFNTQIMEVVQRRQREGDDSDIKSIFESFDADGNGVLTRNELVNGLREFGIKLTKAEKEELLQILDEDGDDEIDWQEFAGVIKTALQGAAKQLAQQLVDAKGMELQKELQDLRGKLSQAKADAKAKDTELTKMKDDAKAAASAQAPRKKKTKKKSMYTSTDHRAQAVGSPSDPEPERSTSEEGTDEERVGGEDGSGEDVPTVADHRAADAAKKKAAALKLSKANAKEAAASKKADLAKADELATMNAIVGFGFGQKVDGSSEMEKALVKELVEHGLNQFQPGLIRLGYVHASDLSEADEEEIDTLAVELKLNEPEKRRLIKAIPEALAGAEAEETREERKRQKREDEEAKVAAEHEAALAKEREDNGDGDDGSDDEEEGIRQDFQEAKFKMMALHNRMKAVKLERLYDIVKKEGYLFVSDLQEAEEEERHALSEHLNLRAPELRRWEQLIGGAWVTTMRKGEEVEVEVDLNALTFGQLLERQGLERLEGELASRGYHDVADFELEDEEAQEAELAGLGKAMQLKPPEMRRLLKVIGGSEEEPEAGGLNQVLAEISLARLHAPLVAKGYRTPEDLVEALEQELATVIKNANLTPPELRRWLQMLEDQGRDDATAIALPGLRGAQPPDELLRQVYVEQRLDSYVDALRSMGYLTATDLQPLMEEADNFDEEELAGVVKGLGLKPPEARRLQAMAEAMEDLAEAEADANPYPEDVDELAPLDLETALTTHNLGRLVAPLKEEGYETVGDLMNAEEEELEAVIMRRRLNTPEFRRWQRVLGREEDEDPTNYSPPRTFRKALALQQLEDLADALTKHGYVALGDLAAAGEEELTGLHRTLGLKPPEQRRLQNVIDEAVDDPDGEPLEVEDQDALGSALKKLNLERLGEKLAAEGYTTAGDVRAAGPDGLDYTQELRALVRSFELMPPEWRRWQTIANPDGDEEPPLTFGQALAVQNLAHHEQALGKLGYNTVADLAGAAEGTPELDAIVAKLALRPPERRRLALVIVDAAEYEEADDVREDEQLPLAQTLTAQHLGHLADAIAAMGYINVGDLAEAPPEEISELLQSLALQPPEERRLRKAIKRDEEEPEPEETPETGPVAEYLEAVGLARVTPQLIGKGFRAVTDLLEADAQELSTLLGELELKAPERRRFQRMVDGAASGGSPLATVGETEELRATLERQGLGRLAEALAELGYASVRDLAESDGSELSAVVAGLALQPAEERRLKKAIGKGKTGSVNHR